MDRVPEDTKEPEYRFFNDGITIEEVAFKRKKLSETREKVGVAFQDAFELVGGVPRLALYADANYGEFIRQYGKMIPRDVDMKHSGTIQIVPALPQTALDGLDEIDVTPVRAEPAQVENLTGEPLSGSISSRDRVSADARRR